MLLGRNHTFRTTGLECQVPSPYHWTEETLQTNMEFQKSIIFCIFNPWKITCIQTVPRPLQYKASYNTVTAQDVLREPFLNSSG